MYTQTLKIQFHFIYIALFKIEIVLRRVTEAETRNLNSLMFLFCFFFSGFRNHVRAGALKPWFQSSTQKKTLSQQANIITYSVFVNTDAACSTTILHYTILLLTLYMFRHFSIGRLTFHMIFRTLVVSVEKLTHCHPPHYSSDLFIHVFLVKLHVWHVHWYRGRKSG